MHRDLSLRNLTIPYLSLTEGLRLAYIPHAQRRGAALKNTIARQNPAVLNGPDPVSSWVTYMHHHGEAVHAIRLDGVDDFLNAGTPGSTNIIARRATVLVYAKITKASAAPWQRLLFRNISGTPQSTWQLAFGTDAGAAIDNCYFFDVKNSGQVRSSAVTPGVPHVVAGDWNGLNAAKIYVDGVDLSSGPPSAPATSATQSNLLIGKRSDNAAATFLGGDVSVVLIWHRHLSRAEHQFLAKEVLGFADFLSEHRGVMRRAISFVPAYIVAPTGISSGEAHSAHAVLTGVVVLPSPVGSSEVFGSQSVAAEAPIAPSGIVSSEVFGSTVVDYDQSALPLGIVSAYASGTHVITTGSAVAVSSIGSAELFGAASLQTEGAGLTPTRIGHPLFASLMGGLKRNLRLVYAPVMQRSGAALVDYASFGTRAALTNMDVVGDWDVIRLTTGRSGHVVTLDGTDDFLDGGTHPASNIIGKKSTIVVLEKITRASGNPWQRLVFRNVSGTAASTWQLSFGTDGVDAVSNCYFFDVGNNASFKRTSAVTPGVPHLVGASYDGASEFQLYVDGKNLTVTPGAGIPDTASQSNLLIGKRSDDNAATFLGGSVAAVLIWHRELSREEHRFLARFLLDFLAYCVTETQKIKRLGSFMSNPIARPDAIASAESFGTAAITLAGATSPVGIQSAEAFGATAIGIAVFSIDPASIGSSEAFGSPSLSDKVNIAVTGISSAVAFGTLSISLSKRNIIEEDVYVASSFSEDVYVESPIEVDVYVTPDIILDVYG